MVAPVKAAYEDILAQIQKRAKPSHYRFELSIYVEGTNQRTQAIQIIDIDTTRNFEVAYSDQIMVSAVFQQIEFAKVIYPNRNKLMAELKRIPIGEMSEEIDQARPIVTKNYRAMVLDAREDSLRGRASFDDNQGYKTLQFQIFDPLIEQLRLQTFGAIFANELAADIIKWFLLYHSKQIKVSEEHSVKGVEIWEPNEVEPLVSTIIPHGTPLLDVPGYIQKYCGGVYNYGIGYYLHSPFTPSGKERKPGRLWYVYPLYDPNRYDKVKYRLDVIILPPNQHSASDRSWYINDSTFYIASTGDMSHVDEKDLQYVNEGNGVRFSKATESFNNWSVTGANIPVADPSKTGAQFFAKGRENGKQAAPFGPRRFTDNVAYELSELTAREVQMVKLAWHNCSSEFLYPGMPARILYVSKKGKQELYGTLLAIEENSSADSPGLTSKRMRTNCALTFAVLPREE